MFFSKILCTFLISPSVLHVLPSFHSLSNRHDVHDVTTFLSIYFSTALSYYTASNRGINDSILNVRDYTWKISDDNYSFNRLSHVIYMFLVF